MQYGTWMHPATKVIDLVMVRAGQRKCCRDVQVMRGADCWTDHKLVRAKLRLGLPRVHSRERKVLPFSVHKLLVPSVRDEYRSCLESALHEHPSRSELSSEDNWQILKSCVVSAAKEVVG